MTTEEQQAHTTTPERGGNALFLILGFIVLGFAAGLLLFGDRLFGNGQLAAVAAPPVLEQLADAGDVETAINQIPDAAVGLAVGSAAPDFVLNDLSGAPVRLSDLRGRPVIVNFWATWCAPCRLEMPELQNTSALYEEIGLVVLAVNREESADVVADFMAELGLTFTALLDQQALVADLYEVFNMPTTYFVDDEGTITAVHRGPLTQGQIDGYLSATLDG